MTVVPATARQPSLIKKNKTKQNKKKNWSIVRQVLHHVRPRVSHLNYCVNAAPCRMLAWGKSHLNVKSCVSPTGPDHSKNRETVFSDHCHQTGPVSGGWRDRNVCQTSKCPKCGTHLPVGSRLTPFRDLGSLEGLDPRYYKS